MKTSYKIIETVSGSHRVEARHVSSSYGVWPFKGRHIYTKQVGVFASLPKAEEAMRRYIISLDSEKTYHVRDYDSKGDQDFGW